MVQYKCLDTYLQPLSLNGLSFETQLFVPFVTGDHPTASGQNLIFSPCWGCRGISQSSTLSAAKMAECVYICFTNEREEECWDCFVDGGILSELGGGWKSCPKLSSWVLKIYPQRLTWTLALSVSLSCCPSFYSNASNGRGLKGLLFQASLGAAFFLFFFYILCHSPEKNHHILSKIPWWFKKESGAVEEWVNGLVCWRDN